MGHRGLRPPLYGSVPDHNSHRKLGTLATLQERRTQDVRRGNFWRDRAGLGDTPAYREALTDPGRAPSAITLG